jgi:hypothetical protein
LWCALSPRGLGTWSMRVHVGIVALAIVATSAMAGDGDAFRSATAWFEISKPTDWHYLTAEQSQENALRGTQGMVMAPSIASVAPSPSGGARSWSEGERGVTNHSQGGAPVRISDADLQSARHAGGWPAAPAAELGDVRRTRIDEEEQTRD